MNKKCEEILKELESENKLKVWWNFKFPEKQELTLKLKDMLDDIVDDKYYLNNYQINMIKSSNYNTTRRRIQEKDYWKDPKCIQVGNLSGGKWDKMNDCSRRIYSDLGISPTVHTCQGGNTEPKIITNKVINVGNVNPSGRGQNGQVINADGLARTITIEKGEGQKILIKNATKKGYLEAAEGDGIDISSRMQYHRGNVQKGMIQTLDCQGGNSKGVVDSKLRIRKLTPLECWRLMGFSDNDFNVAKKALNDTFYKGKDKSNSQLYKQAGNSIVVNVLLEIFKNLFNDKEIL